MTVAHAAPGEVIDTLPAGATPPDLATTLIRTSRVQVVRLVLPPGRGIPQHRAAGEITVHCLAGRVALTALGRTQELAAGQLLLLPGGAEHSLRALEDAVVLVTVLLVRPTGCTAS
jgi:quercetin dioxygenase-like cupin family protein